MKRVRRALVHINKCVEHGTFGMLPCAWPSCPNGVDADEFEDAIGIEGVERRSWRRRQWHSPLGGTYFSWESSDLPNWFEAHQTFWNEARRLKLVPASLPETVYHYTSLDGFIGIVQGGSLWMTEFPYLNDRREVRYGLDILQNTVKEMGETNTREDVRDLLSVWARKLSGTENRVLIASFSGDGDSLSQWRAYGPIAVGFSVKSVALHVDQALLQPVEYDPTVQRKLVQTYVHHLVAAFEADVDGNRLKRIPDVYHKSERLLELAVFFKDPAFRSENEYRLAYVDNPETREYLGIKGPPRLFRVARGRIIPYVPSTEVLRSKDRNFPLEISEVVLGPESDDLLEQGVKEFLLENGLVKVTVRRSLVPLRS